MIGDPGKEQFRNAIVEMRNTHIAAALAPLMTLRVEIVGNDDFRDRGGMDTETQHHFLKHLENCDRWRRFVTHNPDDRVLEPLFQPVDSQLPEDNRPSINDNIQQATTSLFYIPWALDGTDPDIPLNSQLSIPSANGLILLGAIDLAIIGWTRLASRDRAQFITLGDSMRMLGHYQQVKSFLIAFGGDSNRVDIGVGVLPSQEPLGPDASPNRKNETSSGAPSVETSRGQGSDITQR